MKRLFFVLSLLVLVAFSSSVLAQGTPSPAPAKEEKPKVEKFAGVIQKVDQAAMSIEVKGKAGKAEKTLTFVTTADTKITRGKDTLTFADLKEKMLVSVEYEKAGEKLTALSIKVASPKAAPPKQK